MSRKPLEDLPEYVLGTLPEPERRALERELAESAELRRELQAVREALARAHAPAAAPPAPAEGRARLLAALGSGERFSPFVRDLARHFDLSLARVRELLHEIDDPASWVPTGFPGISAMHFQGGPNTVAPDTGFVRLPRGLKFPYHRHLGNEVNYVLEGAILDGDGTLYLPGDAIEMKADTAHEYSVPDDADTLIGLVQKGFEFVPKPE